MLVMPKMLYSFSTGLCNQKQIGVVGKKLVGSCYLFYFKNMYVATWQLSLLICLIVLPPPTFHHSKVCYEFPVIYYFNNRRSDRSLLFSDTSIFNLTQFQLWIYTILQYRYHFVLYHIEHDISKIYICLRDGTRGGGDTWLSFYV